MPDLLIRNPVDGYEMVLVPKSVSIVGSREDEPDSGWDRRPQFVAELHAYYLGLFCVTNEQYVAFLNAVGPSKARLGQWLRPGGACRVLRTGKRYVVEDEGRYGDHPVVQVSWCGADAYCSWAGLRLPSELEWEKGARGCDCRVYPWGNEWNPDCCRHAGNRGDEHTCRVWDFPEGVSPWGCYNMCGNVWEWCADRFEGDAYTRYAAGDLAPPAGATRCVFRGGSWNNDSPRRFRCATRDVDSPANCLNTRGFRCARGIPISQE